MIRLLPIRKVVFWVALLFALAVLLAVKLVQASLDFSGLSALRVAMAGATMLNLLLILWIYVGWQWLWAKIPWLDRHFYPNLNGKWEMVISYDWEGQQGEKKATAEIRQTWTSISIEVDAEDSDSRTIVAVPSKDAASGRPLLYYIFLNTPHAGKSNDDSPYEGAARLKVELQDGKTLSGNYFTSRGSRGRYSLQPS